MQHSTIGAIFAISAFRKRSPRSPVGPIFSFALRLIHRANAGLSLSWSMSAKISPGVDDGCAAGDGDEEKSKEITECGLGEMSGDVAGLGDASSSLSPTPSRILSIASGEPEAGLVDGAAKLMVVSPFLVFPVCR